MSPHVRVAMFDGNEVNWPDWSFRYQSHMAQLGLLRYMRGEVPRPREDEEAVEQWLAKQEQVYHNLVICMQGDALKVIKQSRIGDGSGAWRALENRYLSKTKAKKAQLQARMFNDKNVCREGEDINLYLDTIADLTKQMQDLEMDISETVVKGVVERGLPDSFEPLLRFRTQR